MQELITRADSLLKRTPALTLTSIDENGFPRPVAMASLNADNFHEIGFATPFDSHKVRHYEANPKAGATFYADGENVTLVGNVTIERSTELKRRLWTDTIEQFYSGGIEDDNMCLLCFRPVSGVVVFEGKLSRITL